MTFCVALKILCPKKTGFRRGVIVMFERLFGLSDRSFLNQRHDFCLKQKTMRRRLRFVDN